MSVAILGAGSWGSAIAIHLAKQGLQVMLWSRSTQHALDMQKQRSNVNYLPGIPFPDSLNPTDDLDKCLNTSQFIIIAVPSHAFSEILLKFKKVPPAICWLTKGIDSETNLLLSEVVAKKWGANISTAIISGPSFAAEVAQGLPTALLVAGTNNAYNIALQSLLHHQHLRVYLSSDIIGVQLCGAVKNILAIACGISDGMQLGANARAAIITRGLAEMKRLGVASGALPETFMGLAGLGDLVLTCTDNQSRNRRFGLLIGQGKSSADAEHAIQQVVEGKHNANQINTLAKAHGIQMPICQEINALLAGHGTAKQALENLMRRPSQFE